MASILSRHQCVKLIIFLVWAFLAGRWDLARSEGNVRGHNECVYPHIREQKPNSSVTQLTHWGRDKMAAIFQTTFSNAFSWMKMFKLRLRFHWSLFPRVKLTIFEHWFRLWLGAGQATSHYLNQWWLGYWRIYASLGLNELKALCLTLTWFHNVHSI